MTAWIGFGIAVGITAAAAILATALVLAAAGLCRGVRFLWHHTGLWYSLSAGEQHDTWATDAIKARIASIPVEESR